MCNATRESKKITHTDAKAQNTGGGAYRPKEKLCFALINVFQRAVSLYLRRVYSSAVYHRATRRDLPEYRSGQCWNTWCKQRSRVHMPRVLQTLFTQSTTLTRIRNNQMRYAHSSRSQKITVNTLGREWLANKRVPTAQISIQTRCWQHQKVTLALWHCTRVAFATALFFDTPFAS